MNKVYSKNMVNSQYEVTLMGVAREHRYFYFKDHNAAMLFVYRVCAEHHQHLAFEGLLGAQITNLSNGCPIFVKLLNIGELSDITPNYEFGSLPSVVGFVAYEAAAESIYELAKKSAKAWLCH